MGWFSQIFNVEDRYKVHNSSVDLIDHIESVYSTTLSRDERLKIFCLYLIFLKRENFYAFDKESVDVVEEVKNLSDDMIENLITNILHIKNDKFNIQRYTLELGDSLHVAAQSLMPLFISAKVDNPNISEGQILRESMENILSNSRKKPLLEKLKNYAAYERLFPPNGELERGTTFDVFKTTDNKPKN